MKFFTAAPHLFRVAASCAGMMDCKKALIECNGDVSAASDYLRKKGLTKAGQKAGRIATEGVIASYIHAGNRCAVLSGVCMGCSGLRCRVLLLSDLMGRIFMGVSDMALQCLLLPT